MPLGKKKSQKIPKIPSLNPGLEFLWELPTSLDPNFFFPGIFGDPTGTEPSQEFWEFGILIRNVDPHGELGEFSQFLNFLGSTFPVLLSSGIPWDATIPWNLFPWNFPGLGNLIQENPNFPFKLQNNPEYSGISGPTQLHLEILGSNSQILGWKIRGMIPIPRQGHFHYPRPLPGWPNP